MSDETKKFLNQTFGIDCDKYDEKHLGELLDKVLISLNDKIKDLEIKNNELKEKIYMLENSIE